MFLKYTNVPIFEKSNIPMEQYPTPSTTCFKRDLFTILFWYVPGVSWGMFQGSVGIFLDGDLATLRTSLNEGWSRRRVNAWNLVNHGKITISTWTVLLHSSSHDSITTFDRTKTLKQQHAQWIWWKKTSRYHQPLDIPRTQLTSIFEGQPSETRIFPSIFHHRPYQNPPCWWTSADV